VALGCLVPDGASPALILLEVGDHRATGWIGTATYAQPLDLQLPEAWPRGALSLAGALVPSPPPDRLRPFFFLEGSAAVEVYLGELTIPSGRAIAAAHWRPLPEGLQSSLRLRAKCWTNDDRDAAAAALRWLENWSGSGGRPEGREWTPEQFHKALSAALPELRRKRYRITQQRVAEAVSMHRETLVDYLRDYGPAWTDIKRGTWP
jgi:hypothetical protein